MANKQPRCFQDVILTLQAYWAEQGCAILQPYDIEVGAGTLHPATTLRALGPKPWRAAYVQPSRRPKDGRYGENPNRLQHYYQFQVILKPNPPDLQDLYLQSLVRIGIDSLLHDIRFVEDDWENPTVGAWGLGWEVWCDGMEVSQYTYFQQVGGLDVRPVLGELTYGLERLAMYVFGVENVFDLPFNDPDSPYPLKYRDVFLENEKQQSRFNFELSDPEMNLRWFNDAEATAARLLKEGNVLPAFDYTLKASHLFNLLDARGVVSPTERQSFIARVRELAKGCASAWAESIGRLAGKKLGRNADLLTNGRSLQFEGRAWRISGSFAAGGSALESELWCPLEELQQAMKRQDISLAAVTLAPGASFADVDEFCKERLDLELQATPETVYYASLERHYRPVRALAWLMVALIAGAGVFAGLNTMYGAVVGRVRELATLQTLGFVRRAIALSLVQEGTLLAAAAALAGSAVGLFFINGMAVRFTMGAFALRIDSVALLVGCGTGLLLGIVGALPPAIRAMRLPVNEGLKAI